MIKIHFDSYLSQQKSPFVSSDHPLSHPMKEEICQQAHSNSCKGRLHYSRSIAQIVIWDLQIPGYHLIPALPFVLNESVK